MEKNGKTTPWTPKNLQQKECEKEARKQELAQTEEELLSTSAKRGCREKAKRIKIDGDWERRSPFFLVTSTCSHKSTFLLVTIR